MTRRRLLTMVNPKCLGNIIAAAGPSSSTSQSIIPKEIQHSKTPVSQYQSYIVKLSFQKEEIEMYSVKQLMLYISRMLFVENKQFIDSTFMFYVNPVVEDKVNAEMRDYTVKNLQIMNKVFFELPIDTFVKAVALVDKFITRVKVKPKYMPCVAVACFYIAAKTAEPLTINCPSLETLTQLSKCGGTVQDLERMVDIIMAKLNYHVDYVTSYDFLNIFCKVGDTDRSNGGRRLEEFLEVAQGSLRICYQKPSVVALACLLVSSQENYGKLAKTMTIAFKINLDQVMSTAKMIFQMYHTRYSRQPSSRHSLVWAISKRTMTSMNASTPTSLPTISEEASNCSTNNDDYAD